MMGGYYGGGSGMMGGSSCGWMIEPGRATSG